MARCPVPDCVTVCLAPSLGEEGSVAVHNKQKTSMKHSIGSSHFFSPSCLLFSPLFFLLLLLLLMETEKLAVQNPRDYFLWHPSDPSPLRFWAACVRAWACGGGGTPTLSSFQAFPLISAYCISYLCFPPSQIYIQLTLEFPVPYGKTMADNHRIL